MGLISYFVRLYQRALESPPTSITQEEAERLVIAEILSVGGSRPDSLRTTFHGGNNTVDFYYDPEVAVVQGNEVDGDTDELELFVGRR